MTVTITILGLGQIGGSVGLALSEKGNLLDRRGYDKDLGVARKAENLGAIDRVFINLPNAVTDADLIFLALPMNEIYVTLQTIAPELRDGAVVVDTAPVKGVVAQWAAELLPAGRYYVGLAPALNPAYLHETDSGLEVAHSDLFRDTPMMIAAPPNTPSAAVKLAADLTRLLGAVPLFAEIVEVDSLMASTHILPQFIAAALVNATVDQPGWAEGRKLAGRPYAEVTGPIVQLGTPEALGHAAQLNRDNVLRTLDSFIASLQSLRSDLAAGDETALSERLSRARSGRLNWWKQRQAADWSSEQLSGQEMPTASEIFGRLLGIGGQKRKKE